MRPQKREAPRKAKRRRERQDAILEKIPGDTSSSVDAKVAVLESWVLGLLLGFMVSLNKILFEDTARVISQCVG